MASLASSILLVLRPADHDLVGVGEWRISKPMPESPPVMRTRLLWSLLAEPRPRPNRCTPLDDCTATCRHAEHHGVGGAPKLAPKVGSASRAAGD